MSGANLGAEPAYPWGEHGTALGGLTKREYFAALAMQGCCAAGEYSTATDEQIAGYAVELADALLAELSKEGRS